MVERQIKTSNGDPITTLFPLGFELWYIKFACSMNIYYLFYPRKLCCESIDRMTWVMVSVLGNVELKFIQDLFFFQNLPFDVYNKKALIVKMTLYFASGFAWPYFMVRHQLLKKSGVKSKPLLFK